MAAKDPESGGGSFGVVVTETTKSTILDEHKAIIAQSSVKITECKAKVQAIEAKLHQSKIEKEIQQFLKASNKS